jgi:hypothetical protein
MEEEELAEKVVRSESVSTKQVSDLSRMGGCTKCPSFKSYWETGLRRGLERTYLKLEVLSREYEPKT